MKKDLGEQAIEYLVNEFSKEENKKKIKAKIIDPIFIYVLQQIYPYFIITSVIFFLTFIIALIILLLILKK